jgi:hypothetical protein
MPVGEDPNNQQEENHQNPAASDPNAAPEQGTPFNQQPNLFNAPVNNQQQEIPFNGHPQQPNPAIQQIILGQNHQAPYNPPGYNPAPPQPNNPQANAHLPTYLG